MYHKNGVITESRFRNMSTVQWIFHYLEILKLSKAERKVFIESLDDIQTSIQAFYLLVDRDNAPKMIDTLFDMKKKRAEGDGVDVSSYKKEDKEQKKSSTSAYASDNTEDLPDLLSDEEKDLWKFMENLPEVIEESTEQKNLGKHILPKRSVKDIMGTQATVVESIDDNEKPQLGF